jgi:hypothetical protein
MRSRTIQTVLIFSILLLPSALLHGSDVPLTDWSAPATWRPAGELSAMAVFIPFRPVQPCRVYDSRNFTILTGGTSRTIPMDGVCSLPAGAKAYSVHITAFGSAASSSYGFITAWPTGATQPTISTMNFLGGSQTSTAAVVPAGSGHDINIFTTTTTHFVIDVNGYYAENLGTSDYFGVTGDYAGFGLAFASNSSAVAGSSSFRGLSTGAGRVYGVSGEVSSGTSEAAGVRGLNSTTSSFAYGVLGHLTNTSGGGFSAGVRGQSNSTGGGGIGVWGSHAGSGFGGYFTSADGYGVYATSGGSTAAAARLIGGGGSNVNYGAYATNNGTAIGAAAVRAGTGTSFAQGGGFTGAAILAQGNGKIAVLGQSVGNRAIQGSFGTITDGVFQFSGGSGALGFSSTVGVHSFGDYTGTGAKYFVQPHPTAAGKVIKYIALEGPEAGTYFRGRARFERGVAQIPVPEDFRLTSTEQGLTVQITPVGDFAQYAVIRHDLHMIVVKGSKDVEFFYQVNGVRSGYPQLQPIQDDIDGIFTPESDRANLADVWGEHNKAALVNNGTFNSDGTVNLGTAERLGWAQQWREREEAERRAAEAEAAAQEVQQQQ